MQLEVVDNVSSTSTVLLARARGGDVRETALLALRQTGGRGSNGRHWAWGEDNLALSVLLRPSTPADQAGQWSLLAGLAVLEALGTAGLQLKWPNDIVLNDAKLAGILIESQAGQEGGLDWLVIGIGANLATAPALADRPTASLGGALKPRQAAEAVLARLAVWRATLEREGFAAIRAAWLGHAHPPGTALLVTTCAGTVRGNFAGLAETGALLLDTERGRCVIRAGEVVANRERPGHCPWPSPVRLPISAMINQKDCNGPSNR